MKRTNRRFIGRLNFAIVFFLAPSAWAQVDLGNSTMSGEVEIMGLPGNLSGSRSKYEEYRDLPETLIVPEINLKLDSKKNDYFLEFDSAKPGLDDQNYNLRFGNYGLFTVEGEWGEIPHTFNVDNARTPYAMNGGTYTLPTRATAADIADPTTTSANLFNTWINGEASSVDLDMLNKIGTISIRYTPNPGWSFTGKYWNQNTEGKRAIAFPFGSGSSSNIAELAEPIDYQTNNIQLGGEYAGQGWSVGLNYNGSFFHNSTSTLVFDNPAAAGPAGCADAAAITYATGTGPCRGRVDLYPSNQAHTFSLTGAKSLPFKTHFLGTASYGWRLQDDPFLPFTINSAIAEPTLSRGSLDGDVRPTMINLTLVNNLIDRLNLKAYYRFYDMDNRTGNVSTTGTVRNDQSTGGPDWTTVKPYQYSKNSAGIGASYRFAQWLTGKFKFDWERTHRRLTSTIIDPPTTTGPVRTNLDADEYKIGPTVDIKPLSWLLLRTSYQHSWRFDPGYHSPTNPARGSDFEMFFLTKRIQDKVSLFTEISPWETLSFHAGFDYVKDDYPAGGRRLREDENYSPSVGAVYAPLNWVRFFADYNFDRYDWAQRYNDSITSSGKDKINTFSLASDMDLIEKVLEFRIQYGYSQGTSEINNRGAGSENWPNNFNTWHEMLARFTYAVHKNVDLNFGYYFNRFSSKDYGVDIMKVWMGDLDNNSGQLRSIYLGDEFKNSYESHVALVGMRFHF